MGPIIIFDKSTLQSLRIDEACWLDAFYHPVITPIFFIETLADLQKQVKSGRSPEQVVGNLAEKTPPNSFPNVHHRTLCLAELLGDYTVKMNRQAIVDRGKSVLTGDQKGVFFSQPPEMQALSRWQTGDFLNVERDFARVWRQELSGIDLDKIYRQYRCKLKSLEDAHEKARLFVRKDGSRYATLKSAFESLSVEERERQEILARWKKLGGPYLEAFAPYTNYVMTVDTFFNFAVGADLISRDRPSNKIDLAYLYYLPFCMIFASNDKLHERTAKCFLRSDQLFLKGEELKADLAKLDMHYSALPDDVKDRGIMSFASDPPHEGFLITRLWDQFMRPDWRTRGEIRMDAEGEAKLTRHIKRIQDAAKNATQPVADEPDDFMLIQRVTLGHMGKWRLVPPEAEPIQ